MSEAKRHFIILNGPPGSGKDTIAQGYKDYLWSANNEGTVDVHIHPFKFRLYKDAFSCVSAHMDWHQFMILCTHRVLKNEPSDVFFGLSPRQFLIHVSEKLKKPIHGQDYFGKAIVEDAPKDGLILVPDGGFISELKTLLSVGEPYTVVQVHREGTSFDQDSRDWIASAYKIENNYTIEEAITALHEIVCSQISL